MMHETLADRLHATKGRPTGFDYLRISLAVAVVCWHTVVTSYGADAQTAVFASPWRAIVNLILPLFFALSGFLVAGSLERTPELLRFLALRALRIVPALAAETVLSAFVLGPLLTADPLALYLTNRGLLKYMLNIIGLIHFSLPGLFIHNPFPYIVNGQLWTVPFELQCYLLLATLALIGIARRPRLILTSAVVLQITLFVFAIIEGHGRYVLTTGNVTGFGLVMTFLSGVVIYALRERIPHSFPLMVICLVITLIGLSIPLGDYFIAFTAAYVTVYFGLLNPKANALHRLGDLSYGIFLYGFPLQQMIAGWGQWSHHWYINIAVALPLTFAVAWISWNLVEKRTLEMKHHLRFLRPADAGLRRAIDLVERRGAALLRLDGSTQG